MAHRLILAALLLALAATPASADPILTPLILAVLGPELAGTALFSIGAYSLTVGAAVSALVTVAIGVGLTLLFAPRPPKPAPENGAFAFQQALPYRMFGYGRARLAGAVMLKEEIAGYLVYVAALTGHLVDAFEAIYLNDDHVTIPQAAVTAGAFVVGTRYTILTVGSTNFTLIGASANTIGVTFTATGVGTGTGTANATDIIAGSVTNGADGRYGASAVRIDTRVGQPTETSYDFITSLLPADWTSAHRGDGCASLAMKCAPMPAQNFSSVYPYAAPSPSAILRLAKVYDPRDGTQDPAIPSTWKWSDNAALAILHFLCFSDFGFRYAYSVAILPFVADWIAAANACDDAMALKAGGTEKRYRLGGWADAQQAKITTLQAMLQACDGFISRRGQGYALFVGKYVAPTDPPVTDDVIFGFTIQTDVATEDKVNESVAKYTSSDNGYVSVDTDPIINSVDQAARGGSPRKAQLDLSWVQSTGQASRLHRREMYRQNVTVRGTLTLSWAALNAAFERWIPVQSNSIPRLSNVVIENRKAVISPKTQTVTIDFILSGPDLDAYNPATDESAPPAIPQRPTSVGLPVPSNVIVVPELATDATGPSNVVLAVSWDEPFYNGAPWNVNYTVQWRATGGGPWTQQGFTTPTIAAGRVSVQTNVVSPGASLDVQVASVGTGSSLSTWSATVTVSTVYADIAPAPPTWTSAVGGSGSAALTVQAPPSPNFVKAQFYRAAHGAPFASAVAIGSPVAGSPNTTVIYTDTVAAGTYDYFVVSETSASVASAPAGPETATVT